MYPGVHLQPLAKAKRRNNKRLHATNKNFLAPRDKNVGAWALGTFVMHRTKYFLYHVHLPPKKSLVLLDLKPSPRISLAHHHEDHNEMWRILLPGVACHQLVGELKSIE